MRFSLTGSGVLGLVSVFLLLVAFFTVDCGYLLNGVDANELGIKFVKNEPTEILGPGVYTDMSPGNLFQYKKIVTINAAELPFTVEDPEVVTKDSQRIGVVISGTVRRPIDAEVLLKNWGRYQAIYQNDALITGPTGVMTQIGGQALKVCVGDSNFNEAIIGAGRDILGDCIQRELGERAAGYGLSVANVVIPNVTINPDVQKQLDSITQARLAKNLADQRALQATAEAEQDKAKQQGAILVEQGRIQEKAKQDAITASLQVKALEAQRAQIDASAANQLLQAQKDREIQDARRIAAKLQAEADWAGRTVEAQMYQSNPTYAAWQMTQEMAKAYKQTDKVIVVPEGTNPVAFLGNSGQPQAVIQTGGR